MTDKDTLVSMFQEAARIAESVPEPFRDAAFQRALDALFATAATEEEGSRPKIQSKDQRQSSSGEQPASSKAVENRLLRDIDSTAHPEIHDANSLRDQCLMVLRAAKTTYGVDGLTSGQVARLLTEKFRVRVSERGVRGALAGSGRYVDRVPESKGFKYRIMEAGEQHLSAGPAAVPRRAAPKRRYSTRNKGSGSRQAANLSQAEESLSDASTSPKVVTTRSRRDATSTGDGPAARVRDLISTGWFKSPRTVRTILAELARRGAAYKRTDLTRLMINLVRAGELTRDHAKEDGRAVWHYSSSNN